MYIETLLRGNNTPHNLIERNYKAEIDGLQYSKWCEVSQDCRHALLIDAYHKAKHILQNVVKA